MTFGLHERLAADTFFVADLALCRVLLMNDSRYPWLILVPRAPDVREIHHLREQDQQALIRESSRVAAVLESLYQPDKMNVAALGNIVPQLHLHHVARSLNDPAWPGPVWGHSAAVPYTEEQAEKRISEIRLFLSN